MTAWVERFDLPGAPEGPLAGLTFGVKDLYDVAGHVTGCGNPTWAATHPPARRTAPVIQALLAAGATAVGKTITDELAYSLSGENHWYGMPANPAAPGRIPGGSSSGSASAVASGECDFALGTDTGGSVRIPASFCGLYGLRTSHGALSLEGVMPLAPSFDTVGWFARTPALLRQVGDVLLGHLPPPRPLRRLDGLEFREEWMDAFIILQRAEVWHCHGEWIRAAQPAFGPGVAERFEAASRVTASEQEWASAVRAQAVATLVPLLEEAYVEFPTAPSGPPFPGAGDEFRRQCLRLLCAAGLAGLPQVSRPLREGPLGMSLLGGRGLDRSLLALC